MPHPLKPGTVTSSLNEKPPLASSFTGSAMFSGSASGCGCRAADRQFEDPHADRADRHERVSFSTLTQSAFVRQVHCAFDRTRRGQRTRHFDSEPENRDRLFDRRDVQSRGQLSARDVAFGAKRRAFGDFKRNAAFLLRHTAGQVPRRQRDDQITRLRCPTRGFWQFGTSFVLTARAWRRLASDPFFDPFDGRDGCRVGQQVIARIQLEVVLHAEFAPLVVQFGVRSHPARTSSSRPW